MAPQDDALPPVAAARVERQRASGTAGSMLSVPAAASIQAAGLVPVGEVFGCLVSNFGWTGGFCGAYQQMQGGWGTASYRGAGTPIVTSGESTGPWTGFGPYVRAVEHAWHGALARMLAEARALDADGVVGVVTTTTTLQGRVREFAATGTAVRYRTSPTTTSRAQAAAGPVPWHAQLSGEDVAAALLRGYRPRAMALGVCVASKHEDWQVQAQTGSFSNVEVTGWTALVQAARSQARQRLATDAARAAREGVLVVDNLGLVTFETPCGQERDLHAEAFVTGTVLEPVGGPGHLFREASPPPGLDIHPVIPLTDRP